MSSDKMLSIDTYVELISHTLLTDTTDGEDAVDLTSMVTTELRRILQSENCSERIRREIFAEAEKICESVTESEMKIILLWYARFRSFQEIQCNPPAESDFGRSPAPEGLYCILHNLTQNDQHSLLESLGCKKEFQQGIQEFKDKLSAIEQRCADLFKKALSLEDADDTTSNGDADAPLKGIGPAVIEQLFEVSALEKQIKDLVDPEDSEKVESLKRIKIVVTETLIGEMR